MSNNWSYGFRVGPSQDRASRFVDATLNNPTITVNTQAEAEAVRDEAFSFIDNNSIVPAYTIIADGYYNDDTDEWVRNYVVTQEPPEE